MKSELLLAIPIGIAIGLLLFYFASPIILPYLTPLTTRIGAITPLINRFLQFAKQYPWAIGAITTATALTVTGIWNHVHKVGMAKQEALAAQQQVQDQTQIGKLQQSVISLQTDKRKLETQIDDWKAQNLDITTLIHKNADLTERIHGIEKERDKLIEQKNAAYSVAGEVKKVLEQKEKVH